MSIQLGSKLNAVDIREGDDVYFECTIDAYPKADRIFWKKDVSNKLLGLSLTLALDHTCFFKVSLVFMAFIKPSYARPYGLRMGEMY